jgi:DNA-binding GntR family transcriptional regulator
LEDDKKLTFTRTRFTAAEIAYDEIKSAILRSELIPGQRISLEDWQNKLNISRTPIREAIRRLQGEQLIEQEVNGWLYVKQISEKEIIDLYSVRSALEELAIVEAIERATPEDLDQLRSLQYDMEKNKGTHLVPDIGREFHSLIYEISGNSINQGMIQTLQSQIDRYRYLGTSRDLSRSKTAVDEHEGILLAVLNKDTDKARDLMHKHIINSRDTALASLRLLKEGGLIW